MNIKHFLNPSLVGIILRGNHIYRLCFKYLSIFEIFKCSQLEGFFQGTQINLELEVIKHNGIMSASPSIEVEISLYPVAKCIVCVNVHVHACMHTIMHVYVYILRMFVRMCVH